MRLYTVFHLNLDYSSVDEASHPVILEACYRPLLALATRPGVRLGIEASGRTLERIHELDPVFVATLAGLIDQGRCELVGSGLAQIVAPLVPAEVTLANLRLGNETYRRLLGRVPRLALVNEQAYSPGIVPLYREAGYQALVMEWDNPAARHPDWPAGLLHRPCLAQGTGETGLPLVWNASLSNQQLQRLAHGDLDPGEYLGFLDRATAAGAGTFPLYGGDAEVFDFRPGRYATEAALTEAGEWTRIAAVFDFLATRSGHRFILPGEVLDAVAGPLPRLRLETPAQPVPVKKQDKYNLTRWAVTGRDDLGLNTACWRIFAHLSRQPDAPEALWRELCLLWGSDYRTHITESRWQQCLDRLDRLEADRPPPRGPAAITGAGAPARANGRFLDIETDAARLRLNTKKGLAIDALTFKEIWPAPLVGTLPHGYFPDISHAADYFTGHVLLESPGRAKRTDLETVRPHLRHTATAIEISCDIVGFVVPIRKTVRLSRERAQLEIDYRFDWTGLRPSSLRLGHITALPDAFDRSSLFYATHNGGRDLEYHHPDGPVEHGRPVSMLISASHCLGMTQGVLYLGDTAKVLEITVDRREAAVAPMALFHPVCDSYLFRIFFSLCEMDETSRPPHGRPILANTGVTFTLRGHRGLPAPGSCR